MESTFIIITYLTYIAFASVFIYGVKNFVSVTRAKNSRNEITNLQAKVVTLRMALKARTKMKIKSFRSRFTSKENKGDSIDLAINELAAIRYETANDFQNYFEISKKINGLIDAELKSSTTFSNEKDQKFEDFMGPDYKNEIAIIRILKEITDASEKLNEKIEIYNSRNMKMKKFEPIKKVENLKFPALVDINRVFRDSEDMIKEMQSEDKDLFESAA
jgi:hypothetical protein